MDAQNRLIQGQVTIAAKTCFIKQTGQLSAELLEESLFVLHCD